MQTRVLRGVVFSVGLCLLIGAVWQYSSVASEHGEAVEYYRLFLAGRVTLSSASRAEVIASKLAMDRATATSLLVGGVGVVIAALGAYGRVWSNASIPSVGPAIQRGAQALRSFLRSAAGAVMVAIAAATLLSIGGYVTYRIGLAAGTEAGFAAGRERGREEALSQLPPPTTTPAANPVRQACTPRSVQPSTGKTYEDRVAELKAKYCIK